MLFIVFAYYRHPRISCEEKNLILVSLGKKSYPSKSSPSLDFKHENDTNWQNVIDVDDKTPIIKENSETRKKAKIPLKSIFTSIPVYAIIIGHFSQGWGFSTLLIEMPTYLNEILHFDIKQVS